MDAAQIDLAILSLPAMSSGSIGVDNRQLARQRNEFMADICRKYPQRFAFFATVPFFDDVEGLSRSAGDAYTIDVILWKVS
jgi:predicted TIM-barrel fold metal-dependent hydrolase